MRAEIVAVGTELLLGQIIDTNSSYIAEQLAIAGIDCLYQTRVGDNQARIVEALRHGLTRADAVIVCGGLGPTQDDITREAIAETMGVELERNDEALKLLEEVFRSRLGRGRPMAQNNLRQADAPVGARLIPQVIGTAPGLICPVGDGVIYAVPGVPDEMKEMIARAVVPDLLARSGTTSVILSRTLRTWGMGESVLAETIAHRLDALDLVGPGAPTIAFLASGIEGVKVRVTVKADDREKAIAVLDAEEAELRAILGDVVFGVDDETMEFAIGALLRARSWRFAVAESFTGGLIASRIVSIPGASEWFAGGVVAYASDVKHALLGVPEGPVVSLEAAAAMAEGVRRVTGADVALSTTGVAGPDPQEGIAPGTGFIGIALPGEPAVGQPLNLFGGRNRAREIATISSLDVLRHRLLALVPGNP
jgi:nicotinamide-nucleotide amidase